MVFPNNFGIPTDGAKVASLYSVKEWIDEENRVIHIDGPINDDDEGCIVSTNEVIEKILQYNKEDELLPVEDRRPIWMYINSPGGDLVGTHTLINVMNISKTPVNTVVMGVAASAAGIILACGKKRYALPGTSVLVHSGSVNYGGTKEQAESMNKYFSSLDKSTVDILMSKTKIDPKMYKSKAPKDWWMTAEDALKYGLVDEIVTDLANIC